MKVAILIAQKDFKDETLSNLQLLFGKMDVESQVVGLTLKPCVGYHGAAVKPQAEMRDIPAGNFDVLLIADGPGVDSLRLYDHRPLLDMIKMFHDNNKLVAGVGNGIKVIARSNVIRDARVAKSDEETEKLVRLYRGKPTDDFVVHDKNILTLSSVDKISEFVNMLIQGPKP